MKYNKAIRDKIPEIITKSGHSSRVKKLSNKEFLIEMEKKLLEEMGEYGKSKSIEELADVLEVVYRISELKGISKKRLESIRLQKRKKRGAFSKNLYLVSTSK